jgi:hypothetical protein
MEGCWAALPFVRPHAAVLGVSSTPVKPSDGNSVSSPK